MIPPTPTIYPTPNPANMPFTVPDYGLWPFADDAIQFWHMLDSNWTFLFQAAILLVLVVVGILSLIALIRHFTNEGQSTSAE